MGLLHDALRVDGDQEIAVAQLLLVLLRFELGHGVADQRARNAADGRASGRTAQEREDRSGGNERPESWNRNGADSRKPSKRAAEQRARSRTRGGALGRFRVRLMTELADAAA